MKRLSLIIIGLCLWVIPANAQRHGFLDDDDDFTAARDSMFSSFNSFRDKTKKDFAAYRAKVLSEFAESMAVAWKAFHGEDEVAPPKIEPVVEPQPQPDPQPDPQPVRTQPVVKREGQGKVNVSPINVDPNVNPDPTIIDVVAPDQDPVRDDPVVRHEGGNKVNVTPINVDPNVNPDPTIIDVVPPHQDPIREDPLVRHEGGNKVTVPTIDVDPNVNSKPTVIHLVVMPKPKPQPKPIEPVPEPEVAPVATADFYFFGTPAKVRVDKSKLPRLSSPTEKGAAQFISDMANPEFEAMLHDCLQIRADYRLCDWAYLKMLESLGYSLYPNDPSAAEMLVAALFMQSGYKIRIANARDGSRLYLLYATDHLEYGKISYHIDGKRYYGLSELPKQLSICCVSYPKEQSLSLNIPKSPLLANDLGPERTVKSRRYPDINLTYQVNRNLMDFYTTYPTSSINNSVISRWVMYAEKPMDPQLAKNVREALGPKFDSMTKREAMERILNLAQTGYVYGYDDKIWGDDRAFFPEETMFYPYSDCEDRAIFITRMARDLLGLDCLLVLYPGHMAAAVEIPDFEGKGDYIELQGRRFYIADGTNADFPIGCTMRNKDNSTADVVLLKARKN